MNNRAEGRKRKGWLRPSKGGIGLNSNTRLRKERKRRIVVKYKEATKRKGTEKEQNHSLGHKGDLHENWIGLGLAGSTGQ